MRVYSVDMFGMRERNTSLDSEWVSCRELVLSPEQEKSLREFHQCYGDDETEKLMELLADFPLEVHVKPSPQGYTCVDIDFLGWGSPVLNQNALDALNEQELLAHGIFVPVKGSHERLVMYHVETIDALDLINSSINATELNGKTIIRQINIYSFHQDKLLDKLLFHIPQYSLNELYATDTFVSAYNQTKLTGLLFKLIWDSDDPEYWDERFPPEQWQIIKENEFNKRNPDPRINPLIERPSHLSDLPSSCKHAFKLLQHTHPRNYDSQSYEELSSVEIVHSIAPAIVYMQTHREAWNPTQTPEEALRQIIEWETAKEIAEETNDYSHLEALRSSDTREAWERNYEYAGITLGCLWATQVIQEVGWEESLIHNVDAIVSPDRSLYMHYNLFMLEVLRGVIPISYIASTYQNIIKQEIVTTPKAYQAVYEVDYDLS